MNGLTISELILKEIWHSLLEVKDSIIEALKAENLKLQQKVEKLENRVSELEADLNKKDQYT